MLLLLTLYLNLSVKTKFYLRRFLDLTFVFWININREGANSYNHQTFSIAVIKIALPEFS